MLLQGMGKEAGAGEGDKAEDVWAMSCRGSSRLLGPSGSQEGEKVKVCAGSYCSSGRYSSLETLFIRDKEAQEVF